MNVFEKQKLASDGQIFTYYPPKGKFIGAVSIRHSGETIPEVFKEYLIDDFATLSRDVDTAVDQLVEIERLNEAGIAVIKANIHRACIDLNRPKETAALNWKQNSHGVEIVKKELSDSDRALLTQKYYAPYYEMLKALLNELKRDHKRPSFIDLHSMPSTPTQYHLNITPNQDMERPDFCVSDIEGKSCEKSFIDFVSDELSKTYNKVYQNKPYYGGHVTRHIDATFPEANNIQIEIKRGIYLKEAERVLNMELVAKLKPILTDALIATFEKFA